MPDAESREEQIFLAALEQPPAARADFVRRSCGDDTALIAAVGSLLRAHEEAGDFLEGSTALDAAGDFVHQLATTEDLTGRTLGPYTLVSRLGEGGVGVVYEATQTVPLRRSVALKVVKPGMDSREVLARFETERHALALMDHPGIARVFDAGLTPEGRPYFALELVRGVPITRYCDQQKLAPAARLRLFAAVCGAVQHAHQKGVIHRDLKPSNILVTADGQPKLIDFGIAKATTAPLHPHVTLTQLTQLLGTPAYMSPEQLQSGADLDTRSDIYALGTLLCELLTGRTPYEPAAVIAAGLDELRRRIREDEPARPSTLLTTLDQPTLSAAALSRRIEPAALVSLLRGDLDWIVLCCLEKDRARRYATADALAADIRRHLAHEPLSVGAPSRWHRAKKFLRRHRAAVVTSAAFAALLLGATVLSTLLALRARTAERLARDKSLAAFRARALADEQRAKAQASERRAQTEAATSAAISEFLRVDLLGQASPEAQRDPDVRLRAIVDRAAQKLDGRFPTQPLVEAAIREMLGDVYTALGDYPAMQAQLAHAARLHRAAHGPDAEDTLRVAIRQFHGLRLQSKLPEAEALGRDTLARLQRTLGREATLTFQTQVNLAAVLITRGRFADAEPLLRDALPVAIKLRGPEHANTLVIQTNLALIAHELGRYADAAALAEQTLATKRRALGPDHPQTITTIVNLSATYCQLGRSADGIALAREALAIRRRVIGPEHPLTLTTTTVLAQALTAARQLDEAATLLTANLPALRTKLGPEHGDTLGTALALAEVHFAAGRLDEADALAADTLAALTRKLGPAFPDTLDTRVLRARIALAHGDRATARDLLAPAAETARETFGATHPRTQRIEKLLAESRAP